MRWGLSALALAFAITACGESSPTDTGAGSGQGQLAVYLKDAPGDADSVWVQVNDVMVTGGGPQVSLLQEPTGLINLIQLRDTAAALAEGQPVDTSRTFTQVRLVLGGAVLLTETGDVYSYGGVEPPNGLESTGDLVCPSCSQSGLKINIPGGVSVEEGQNAALLLDFDVSQSFGHVAGQSGKWIMHPVIQGTVSDQGSVETGQTEGTISGTVALGADITIPMCGGENRTLEAFIPAATTQTLTNDQGDPLRFTGETQESGDFEISVLGADDYALGYESETVFDTEKLVWDASVDPAQVTIDPEGAEATGVAYTVTSVTCEPVSSGA